MNKKKLLYLILAITMVVAAMPVIAIAAEPEVKIIDKITIELPQNPGVTITLTNVMDFCYYTPYVFYGEPPSDSFDGYDWWWLSLIFTPDSTLCSNQYILIDKGPNGYINSSSGSIQYDGTLPSDPDQDRYSVIEPGTEIIISAIANDGSVSSESIDRTQVQDWKLQNGDISQIIFWSADYLPFLQNRDSDFHAVLTDFAVSDKSETTPPPTASPPASPQTVNPTASTVYVNGEAVAFEAYNIGGYNFFKLRDLAYVLNGTEKQFEVGYDNNTKAIALTSGAPYTSVDGDMVQGDGKQKTATPTASKIYLDGEELNLTAYNIGGNNFFKLRDLMEAIDVYVGYDNATKAITLDTSKGYVPE